MTPLEELDHQRKRVQQAQSDLRLHRKHLWCGWQDEQLRQHHERKTREAEQDLLDALDTLWGVQHRYEATRALTKSEIMVQWAEARGIPVVRLPMVHAQPPSDYVGFIQRHEVYHQAVKILLNKY